MFFSKNHLTFTQGKSLLYRQKGVFFLKIKEICELTGLTDKTIRFYIENNLITPQCTQNHLGRRTFTFDEQNCEELNDIATLRKAGFSVAQIKEIQEEHQKSKDIIAYIISTKERQIEENKQINQALYALDPQKAYTVKEIADALREPAKNVEALQDEDDAWYIIIKWAKIIVAGFVVSYPIACMLYFLFTAIHQYGELLTIPDENFFSYLMSWVCAFFPAAVFLISFLIKKARQIKRFSILHNTVVLAALLVISIWPIRLYTIPLILYSDYRAETEAFEDYMITTHDRESHSIDEKYIFPESIPEYIKLENDLNFFDSNTKYFYTNYYSWDSDIFEMYAEWTLSEENFKNELERIYSLGGTEYTYGDFTIKVFNRYIGSYSQRCLAFAYNDETNTVRYICYSGYLPQSNDQYCSSVNWII